MPKSGGQFVESPADSLQAETHAVVCSDWQEKHPDARRLAKEQQLVKQHVLNFGAPAESQKSTSPNARQHKIGCLLHLSLSMACTYIGLATCIHARQQHWRQGTTYTALLLQLLLVNELELLTN